jgi:flagellar motor switch protein FliN/FliY
MVGKLGPDEIETLMHGTAAVPPPAAASGESSDDPATPRDIKHLRREAEETLAALDALGNEPLPDLVPYRFDQLAAAPASLHSAVAGSGADAALDVRIELGRTQMHLDDVLTLRRGSIVALDNPAGEPVDVYANGHLVARGEVLSWSENFCVRVNELIRD